MTFLTSGFPFDILIVIQGGFYMKRVHGPIVVRVFLLIMVLLVGGFSFYAYHQYDTFNRIHIIAKRDRKIEYGKEHYNIQEFIQDVEGEIISIRNEINAEVVGEQEVILEVKKENVVKEVPIVVSIVDTVSPVIQLKEEKVVITKGNDYNLIDNILSVQDEVDGDISYENPEGRGENAYYYFEFDEASIEEVGDHEVKVVAKDKNGNISVSSFTLTVEAPKRAYYRPVYSNLAANSNAGSLVSIAYSYLGYPYVGGTNGPYSFDCSGFVQFVYKQVGISVSRSTYTQINDGLGVSYEAIQPGDIISWGYSDGTVTHSSLYVGDGKMIHAANPSVGVILSDVSYWLARSGTQILSIRRIQG